MNHARIRKLALGAFIVSGLSFVGSGVAYAHNPDNPAKDHLKVTLCHYDGSNDHGGSGKYNQETVDIASANDALSAKGHNDHDHDIIPAYSFPYDGGVIHYPGKNLENYIILDNGCKSSEETTTTTCPKKGTTTSTSSTSSTSTSSTSSSSTSTSSSTVVTSSTTSVPGRPTGHPNESLLTGSMPNTGSGRLLMGIGGLALCLGLAAVAYGKRR